MTVYVDNMRAKYRRMKMSHMLADTDAELHSMAGRVGVARRHHQGDHYDICQSKRALAVQYGAVEVTLRQCAAMRMRRRETGALGNPDDALEWVKNRAKQHRGSA